MIKSLVCFCLLELELEAHIATYNAPKPNTFHLGTCRDSQDVPISFLHIKEGSVYKNQVKSVIHKEWERVWVICNIFDRIHWEIQKSLELVCFSISNLYFFGRLFNANFLLHENHLELFVSLAVKLDETSSFAWMVPYMFNSHLISYNSDSLSHRCLYFSFKGCWLKYGLLFLFSW